MSETQQTRTQSTWSEPTATALLVLVDGTVLEGTGFGATGHAVGEVCFNTAMTGYEEMTFTLGRLIYNSSCIQQASFGEKRYIKSCGRSCPAPDRGTAATHVAAAPVVP